MKIFRWFITLAYAGIIFYLSSRTWNGTPWFTHSDKVIHILMYAGLGFLCLWSLRSTALRKRALIFPFAVVLTTFYGLSDEIHQMFVPGRSAEFFDLISDGLGAFLGAYLACVIAKKFRRENTETT